MPRHAKRYDDDIADAKGDFDEDYDDGYDVKQHPSSKRAKEMKKPKERNEYCEEEHKVPRALHGAIIGPKGSKLRQFEADTNCELDIPRRESNSDTIYICGGEADVRRAKKLLDEIVREAEMLNMRRTNSGELQESNKSQASFPTLPGEEKVVLQLDVEKFAHGKVIGTQAIRLHDLKKRLTRQEHAAFDLRGVDVNIPLQDDVSQIISIHMPKSMAEKAEKVVTEFFEFYDIKQHLLSVKLVDGISMQGDNASKGRAKKQKAAAAPPAAAADDAKPVPAVSEEPAATAAKGAKKGREDKGKKGSKKTEDSSSPSASRASSEAFPSGLDGWEEGKATADEKKEKKGAASKATAAPKKAESASKKAAPETQQSRNQRKPRPANGPLVDLLLAGYTHRVQPKRSFD